MDMRLSYGERIACSGASGHKLNLVSGGICKVITYDAIYGKQQEAAIGCGTATLRSVSGVCPCKIPS
jgi:hypothetical protein